MKRARVPSNTTDEQSNPNPDPNFDADRGLELGLGTMVRLVFSTVSCEARELEASEGGALSARSPASPLLEPVLMGASYIRAIMAGARALLRSASTKVKKLRLTRSMAAHETQAG
jgi:hypothetical protein